MKSRQSPIEWATMPLKRFADFSGRSGRAEYWWFSGAFFLAGLAADAIDLAMGSEIGVLGLTVTLGLMIPLLAVTVRRLHDTNRTGWWLAAIIVPAALFASQATQSALQGKPDAADPTTSATVSIFASLLACVVVTIFTLLPGTKAANRYGHDPYGPGADALA